LCAERYWSEFVVKVVFIQPDQVRVELEVQPGTSGMEAARFNNVQGIEAQCGGSAACATCHVYVDETYLAKLPPIKTQEHEILDCTAAERRANSRLSCQIPLTEKLDGIVFIIPDRQI
jgi:ferredoxin, 2Fe-2S